MNFLAIDQGLIGPSRKDRTYSWLLQGKPNHETYLRSHDSARSIQALLTQDSHAMADAARSCYLSEVHNHRISKSQVEQAAASIVRYGVRWGMLDQTILQAIGFLEAYLARTPSLTADFLSEVALVSLEIAIKNNEVMVLSFKDCAKLLHPGCSPEEEQRLLAMLRNLERHILLQINYRVNLPSALDFLLEYSFQTCEIRKAQALVAQALPWLYYLALNYDSSRGRSKAACALAALAYALQEDEDLETRDAILFSADEASTSSAFELLQEMNSERELPQGFLVPFPKIQSLVTPVQTKGSVVLNLSSPESTALTITPCPMQRSPALNWRLVNSGGGPKQISGLRCLRDRPTSDQKEQKSESLVKRKVTRRTAKEYQKHSARRERANHSKLSSP